MKSSFGAVERGLADLLDGVEPHLGGGLADRLLGAVPVRVVADVLLGVGRVAERDLRLVVVEVERVEAPSA